MDFCLDPVSANSEKGKGSEWAVRVGQRLPFAKHLADTACFWLVLLAAFWWTIERGLAFDRRAINYVVLRR